MVGALKALALLRDAESLPAPREGSPTSDPNLRVRDAAREARSRRSGESSSP